MQSSLKRNASEWDIVYQVINYEKELQEWRLKIIQEVSVLDNNQTQPIDDI